MTTQNEPANEPFAVRGLRQGSLSFRILNLLRANPSMDFTCKTIATRFCANYESVRTALKRLDSKNLIIKRKIDGFCFYFFPGGTMEQIYKLFDLCAGLPYKQLHNLCLYHEMKVNQRTILGVEHTLGTRKGYKFWRGRRLSWELGRNSRKPKGPSITVRLKCSEKPLDFDEWIAFLNNLEGMLGLAIFDNPADWKLLSADFNHDSLIQPNERWCGRLEIDVFTNALARIYCKDIDGQWFERREIAYESKAEYAISLEEFRGQILGSVTPHIAENLIVASLSKMERNFNAQLQSQRRMEKQFKEELSSLSGAIKDLAAALKDLKEGSP